MLFRTDLINMSSERSISSSIAHCHCATKTNSITRRKSDQYRTQIPFSHKHIQNSVIKTFFPKLPMKGLKGPTRLSIVQSRPNCQSNRIIGRLQKKCAIESSNEPGFAFAIRKSQVRKAAIVSRTLCIVFITFAIADVRYCVLFVCVCV